MVRCEECLRANAPTRVSCFYCAAALPRSETSADLVKPNLRPIETWELAYNNIFLPHSSNKPTTEALSEAANLLKLDPDQLSRLIATGTPMPLARTPTFEDASAVTRSLQALGLETTIISDIDLDLKQSPPVRLRALNFDENGMTPKQISQSDESQIHWSQFVLLVTGRLSTQRVELQERKSGRGENEIVDTSQFFTDEVVVDLYTERQDMNFRIAANGFDFSCLTDMRLVAAENFSLLLDVLREKSPEAAFDDSYNRYKQALDSVWPSGQHTGSRGWRRERPGKYSIGAVTESSNEMQFTRYSRLRYFFRSKGI